MKFRSVVLALSLAMTSIAVANCGADDRDGFGRDGGSDFLPIDGGFDPNCKRLTCADLGINCGPTGDGCGGLVANCGTCSGRETCGGGGGASRCGGNKGCVPKTCAELGIECGPAGDGCGGLLACGSCASGQTCGGGGPSECGSGTCTPKTACEANECGPTANGCGGLLDCAKCPSGQICGGGGPGRCGVSACTKTTCAAQNANCGYVADGCGGSLDCGGNACATAGHFCGGGGPNRCGPGVDAGPPPCVGYCQDQTKNATCAVGAKTKLTGKVFAPNGQLPIPGARIYVPNGSKTWPHGVPTFTDGVASATCEQCTEKISDALVDTTSAADGSFTLDDVPPETTFPLVIQLGRWRRMITIGARARCSTTTLTADQTRLPKRQNETSIGGVSRDNIPLIGISTGRLDGLECVLRKVGIDEDEFTNPNGIAPFGGRIRLHRDSEFDPPGDAYANGGARINANTPRTDQSLTDTDAHLEQYDAVIFGCPGAENPRSSDVDDRVRRYADKGGRVFATHFNYVYLANRTPWNSTALWDTAQATGSGNVGGGNSAVWVGEVNTGSGPTDKRSVFAQWLGDPQVGALAFTNPPRVRIIEARSNAVRPIASGAEEWITYSANESTEPAPTGAKPVLHYTFNTPWGASAPQQCGRVLFSDFHVTIGSTQNVDFPSECLTNGALTPLTAQEKILAFFLFDLTSCIQPTTPTPQDCVPRSCIAQDIACGKAGNGCGQQIDCGACSSGLVCQGSPGRCVAPTCAKTTCAAQHAECGKIGDGCGGTLDCGACKAAGDVCGGGGPNQCGGAPCVALSCGSQRIGCGPAGNGCGDLLECGTCPAGQSCGGGGTPNQCGAPDCKKLTCREANAVCGFLADGCGGALDCGSCPGDQTCGGGGTPNQCGGSAPK